MKQAILLAALIWVADFAKAQAPTQLSGVIETYKVVNGMSIRATVYNVDDGQRHRVAIVVRGGGYKGGLCKQTLPRSFRSMDSWVNIRWRRLT